jgi:hypothetical protein
MDPYLVQRVRIINVMQVIKSYALLHAENYNINIIKILENIQGVYI